MKTWFKKQWLKFRKWTIGLLVAIGLISAPLVYSEVVNFTYTEPTQNEDGTTLVPAPDYIARLYCNTELVEEKTVDGEFNPNLSPGTYDCYATVVNNGVESAPSNSVTKTVQFPVPRPPILNP